MPPSDGPMTQATRAMPSARSASRAALARSSTESSGNAVPYGRPDAGAIESGLDDPKGLPSELMQTTCQRRVSMGRASPIIDSHHPSAGSRAEDAACADGDSPVKSSTVLSSAGLRRPQLSYATTGFAIDPPRYSRSGCGRFTSFRAGKSGGTCGGLMATDMDSSLSRPGRDTSARGQRLRTGGYLSRARLLALAALAATHEAVALALLPRRELVAPAGVRVLVSAELDTHRRPHEPEHPPEVVLEITPVGVGHVLGLVAMYHHHGWIAAALVGIAQLDAPPAHQRRLVARDRGFERARELRGRQLAHRRTVRDPDRIHHIADTGSVACGDEVHGRKGQEIEPEVETRPDRFALIARDPVPLVDGDHQAPPLCGDEAEEARILLRHRFLRVEHADYDLRLVDRLQRLDDAVLLDRVVHARAAADARGVDQHVGLAIALERDIDAVTRRARLIEGDQALLAEQPVDQGRLADVWAADHRDPDRILLRRSRFLGAGDEAVERPAHQRLETFRVRSRYGHRLAEAERVEVRRGRAGLEPLGLVDHQQDGFAAAAQLCRHVEIGRRKPRATVDDQQHAVGVLDRLARLGRGQPFHAIGAFDQAAGVDDHCRAITDTCIAVLAVPRQTRNVCD